MLCRTLRLIMTTFRAVTTVLNRWWSNVCVRFTAAPVLPSRGGENTVVVTEKQLEIIRTDGVLSVVSPSPAETPSEAGGLDVLGVDGLNPRILNAISGLDKGNPDHFTAAGEPKVKAVSAALGESVTAAQIKAARDGAGS